MEGPRPISQRLQRLREIAREYDAVLDDIPSGFSGTRQVPTFRVHEDEEEADAILATIRADNAYGQPQPKGLKRAFTSNKKQSSSFTYKELHQALTKVIGQNGSAGVAEVLLNRLRGLGHDPNLARKASTNVLKKVKGVDQSSQRGHLLQTAVELRRLDFTQILAPLADQSSLDEALPISLTTRQLAVTEVLLLYGANAAICQTAFQQAAGNGDTELVELLLQAPSKPTHHCITESLLAAAICQSLRTVLILVRAGADADHNDAQVLMHAVETGREDIAVALVTGPKPPSPRSLDRVISVIFSQATVNLNEKLIMAEVLLCAGPDGDATNEGLIKATWMACVPMMQLLLEARASVNYSNASAVRHAVSRNRKDLIEVLLQTQNLSPDLASAAVAGVDWKAPSEVKIEILSILLIQGASGHPVNEMLVHAVETDDKILSELLVSAGASTDFNGAKALAIAVSTDMVDMVSILLQGKPSRFSLSLIFPAIPDANAENHLRMAQMLLKAGARGPEVDYALQAAVSSPEPSRELIELLVNHGADVSRETLLSVTAQGNTPILRMLMKGQLAGESCSAAISMAMKLQHNTTRYHILKLLLRRATSLGIGRPETAQAVLDIFRNTPDDEPLLRLLCQDGQADINFQGGQAVIMAIGCADPKILDIVLSSSGGEPNSATVSTGLACAMALPVSDVHRRRKAEALLQRGRPQEAMDLALIQEIRWALSTSRDLSVLQLLLTAGADVNAAGACPVCLAVRDPEIMDMILLKRPSAQSLSMAFPLAVALQDSAKRSEICSKLLKAGAAGDELSKALCAAAKEVPPDMSLMRLLLPQADVNFSDGRAVRLVVRRKQADALSLLLKQNPRIMTLWSGMQEAMKIQGQQDRFNMVKLLLEAGTKGEIVSDALITSVNAGDQPLSELLVRFGSSVEHQGGQGIVSAASAGDRDMLKLLVGGTFCPKPTLSTLTAGFGAALELKNKDRDAYYDTIQILLSAGMRGLPVDATLVEAVKEGDANLKMTEMIYSSGASVEFQEGEAVDIAARSGSVDTLSLLLAAKPSQNILKRAFRSGMILPQEQRYAVIELIMKAKKSIDKHVTNSLLHAVQENPADRQLVRLLLSFQVFDEGQSITHAANMLDLETFKILTESPKAPNFMTAAFQEVMSSGGLLKSTKGLTIAELMLSNGASGDSVGDALVSAVDKVEDPSDTLASHFLDLLLGCKADVNHRRGLVLQRAAQRGNPELIQKLLDSATTDSRSMAFPYLFTSKLPSDESTMLEMIQAFIDGPESVDTAFKHPDPIVEPVLFMALDQFPRKTQILKGLLDAGFNPHQGKMHELDPQIGSEYCSILCWALAQPEKRISSDNIGLLIDAGANMSSTSKSKLTPVILSIRNQRSDVLEKLISKGAKVSAADEDGISPLAMASGTGNAELMEQLLKAGADTNDGSLHDAARELRCDAMRVLIKYGHDADYPSDRHEGRSALAELCLNAVDNGPSFATDLEEAIECLIANDADVRLQCAGGKTIFHYALDSVDPLSILRILLKILWKVINEDCYLYNDGFFTYSLTKYVEKGIFLKPHGQRNEIIQLLRQKRAKDRFWANSIDSQQPSDLVGAPQSIMDEVERQKARAKRLSEQQQELLHTLELKRMAAVEEDKILETQSEQTIRRQLEAARAQERIREDGADHQLRLDTRAELERQRLLRIRQTGELQHARAIGEQQVSTQRAIGEAKIEQDGTANMLQIEYTKEKIEKENDGLRARLAIMGSGREDEERAHLRQHERMMSRLKTQKKLVDSTTSLANNLRNAGANQRQIGYIMGEVGN